MNELLRRHAPALAILVAAMPVSHAVPVAQREFDQVLQRKPDVKHGAQLYGTCAACHGSRGEGVSDGTVPAIAGQPFTIVAKQLVDFRAGQRGDTRMAHFTSTRHLAYSQHIADVAAYIATLPPLTPKRAKDDATPTDGALVYARHCERCHGPGAEGKEDSLAPRLAAQHYEYMLRQLDDAAEGRRPAMKDTHAALITGLTHEQILAVTGYLAAGAQ